MAGTVLAVAVVVWLLATQASAAGTGEAIIIEPVPRFDDSEVNALIEKPSIVAYSVDKPRIASGGSAKLTWRVTNADSVSISNVGNVGLSGTRPVSPAAKTTYTLSARNRNGTVTRSVTVDITNLAAVIGTIEIVTPVFVRENVHFNFVEKASTAKWASSKPLSFGAAGGTKGWARVIKSVRAEDNKDYEKVLQMVPETKPDGFIYGEYKVAIPPEAKFLATVGFTRGHGSSDGATLSVQVRPPPVRGRKMPWKQILIKTITPNQKLDPIAVDLGAYANKTVSIRLVVNARRKANDDMALWIAPRIVK